MKRRLFHGGAIDPLFQVIILVMALGVLGVLAYRQVARVGLLSRPVVVADQALIPGSVLKASDLREVRMRAKNVSVDAMRSVSELVGRVVTRPKLPGDPLVTADLMPVKRKNGKPLADIIPDGRMLTTLTIYNLTLPQGELRQGDRVDIIASGRGPENRRVTRVIARDVYIVGHLVPPGANGESKNMVMGVDLSVPGQEPANRKSALMIALKPEQVVPVAEINGSDVHISLVLHASQSVKRGELLPIELRPVRRTVELIAGLKRQQVPVP